MKISFTDWSRHIYLLSVGWEWDRADAFPYLGQVPLPRWVSPRWVSPRWAQEFRNHCNMAGRAIKSPVGGVTLKVFQAGSSFVLEAPLSLEPHTRCHQGDTAQARTARTAETGATYFFIELSLRKDRVPSRGPGAACLEQRWALMSPCTCCEHLRCTAHNQRDGPQLHKYSRISVMSCPSKISIPKKSPRSAFHDGSVVASGINM